MGISVFQGASGFSDSTPVADTTAAGAAGTGLLASRSDHRHQFVIPDTGWITPSFQNGWVQYDAAWGVPGYRRVGGIVYLKGLIKNGALGGVMFNLPVGFRPLHNTLYCVQRDSNVDGRIDVFPNGDVIAALASTGWTGLNNVVFVADG